MTRGNKKKYFLYAILAVFYGISLSTYNTPIFSDDRHHCLFHSLGYTTDKYTSKAAEGAYGP